MGDILSKLQMVSEKIGVTETAHTIEEQVDLISESLDKIPHSTNIAEALDDLSDVAQNINNEEVYVDKTVTENGTYLPADDEATAYSKVVVDVDTMFNTFSCELLSSNGVDKYIYKKDGKYDFSDEFTNNVALLTPVKELKVKDLSSIGDSNYITFVPDTDEFKLYIGGIEKNPEEIFVPRPFPGGETVWELGRITYYDSDYSPYDGKTYKLTQSPSSIGELYTIT